MPSPVDKKIDGHRKRVLETRGRIVAAAIELMREENINPTAEEIAVRANIGRRTVFRHFKNMEGLIQLITLELAKPLAIEPVALKSSDWQGQMYEMMNRRLAMFELFMPFQRASEAHRHSSPTLQAIYNAYISTMRSRLIRPLPPEIPNRQPLLEAIDVALSIEVWQTLRVKQNLSVADSSAAVETLLSHLLSPYPNGPCVPPDVAGG
ncbi:TetR/AcrR family transcriptional regulator [Sphingorhabdus sp.]|uniref:TetR/AcrR family transcriptional regulator n=1 Tax=Sphingorhabdus sp. TaxID=1902408 RepID=UPI002624384C|nr:TetR/AcrR family transcriptional regulator [Sphingorhabdus sp.]MDH4398176.1 TetR/AcrR family transcriptional regulator [Sphingorhabdus sp.]